MNEGDVNMADSSFLAHFSLLEDKRQQAKVRHKLIDVVFIAVAAFIAGCDDWDVVLFWANERIEWFKRFLELPNGIPSIHTFRRTFRMIEPRQFEKCFIGWARELARDAAMHTVAIDGKTLRGAKDGDESKSSIHIVSAWLSDNGLTLGEVKTGEKSNEITAIPELLDLLFIEGSVVTIDAAGTQKDIAAKIVNDNHADYVLAAKMNQPNLCADIELYFTGRDREAEAAEAEKRKAAAGEDAAPVAPIYLGRPAFLDDDYQYKKVSEKGHGRIEQREYFLVPNVDCLRDKELWTGAKSVGMVVSKRTIVKTNETSTEERFFICSITGIDQFAASVRDHWGIESTHWVLDVAFSEDKSRIRKENEPENVALLRRIALNIHKLDKNKEIQMARMEPNRKIKQESYNLRRHRAFLKEDYLEKVLIHNLL